MIHKIITAILLFIFNIILTQSQQTKKRKLFHQELQLGTITTSSFVNWSLDNIMQSDGTDLMTTCTHPGNIMGIFNNQKIFKDFSDLPPHSDIGIKVDLMLFGTWPGGDDMNEVKFNIDFQEKFKITGSQTGLDIGNFCDLDLQFTKILPLEVEIEHTSEDLRIELLDNLDERDKAKAAWGIHSLEIYYTECHPSCNKCNIKGECIECIFGANKIGQICECQNGQYVKDYQCVYACPADHWFVPGDGEEKTCVFNDKSYTLIDMFTDNTFIAHTPLVLSESVTSPYTTCGDFKYFGGSGKFQGLSFTYSQSSLPHHTRVKISAEFLKLEDWADAQFTIDVDGTLALDTTFAGEGSQSICGALGKDKIFSINHIVDHTADTINIRFEDMIPSGGTGYWGIRNLSISLELCAVGCIVCVLDGSTVTDKCAVCDTGLNLFDTYCVETCPSFTTLTSGVCVDAVAETFSYPYYLQMAFFDEKFDNSEFVSKGWGIQKEIDSIHYARFSDCDGTRIAGGFAVGKYSGIGVFQQNNYTDIRSHHKVNIRWKNYHIDGYDNQGTSLFIDETYVDEIVSQKVDGTNICGGPDPDELEVINDLSFEFEHITVEQNLSVKIRHMTALNPFVRSGGIRDVVILLDACKFESCGSCKDDTGCSRCNFPQVFDADKNCVYCLSSQYTHKGLYNGGLGTGTCIDCPHECLTCSNLNPTECLVCKDIREDLPTCTCPDSYYNDPALDPCQVCDFRCKTCDINGCLTCVFNRNLAGTACSCTTEGTYIDYFPTYLHCGTCFISVNTITFSADYKFITFDFGDIAIIEIKGIHIDDFLKPSPSICQVIFPIELYNRFGGGYTCHFQTSAHKVLQINLGFRPTVTPGTIFSLNGDKVKRENCPESYFLEIINTNIELTTPGDTPDVELFGPEPANICVQKTVGIKSITNDEGFGLSKMTWILEDMDPMDQEHFDFINNNLLAFINRAGANSINFKAGQLKPDTQYTIKLEYKTYLDTEGEKTLIFVTLGNEGPYIYFDYADYYFERRNPISISAKIKHMVCENEFTIDEVIGTPIELQYQQSTGVNLGSLGIDKTVSITDGTDILEVDPFVGEYHETEYYTIQVAATIVEKSLQFITRINIHIEPSALINHIIGGSKTLPLNAEIPLEAYIEDLSLDPSLPGYTPEDGINYTWSCFSLKLEMEPCIDAQTGIELVFDAALNQTLSSGQLHPYGGYIIQLDLEKDGRTSSSQIQINLLNKEDQTFVVQFENQYVFNVINLNDELLILPDVQFTPTSIVTVSLIYAKQIKATLTFPYKEIKLRIWDYFIKLDSVTKIDLKISYFDPFTMGMPSFASQTLNVNLPPYACNILFNYKTGFALTTKYLINVFNCLDDNPPFTYKFIFFESEAAYKKQLIEPTGNNGQLLSDFQSSNQVESYLSQGYEAYGYNTIILVSVKDRNGAIFNITSSVIVNPMVAADADIYSTKIQEAYDFTVQSELIEKQLVTVNILIDDINKSKIEGVKNNEFIRDLQRKFMTKVIEAESQLNQESELDYIAMQSINTLLNDINNVYYLYTPDLVEQEINVITDILQRKIDKYLELPYKGKDSNQQKLAFKSIQIFKIGLQIADKLFNLLEKRGSGFASEEEPASSGRFLKYDIETEFYPIEQRNLLYKKIYSMVQQLVKCILVDKPVNSSPYNFSSKRFKLIADLVTKPNVQGYLNNYISNEFDEINEDGEFSIGIDQAIPMNENAYKDDPAGDEGEVFFIILFKFYQNPLAFDGEYFKWPESSYPLYSPNILIKDPISTPLELVQNNNNIILPYPIKHEFNANYRKLQNVKITNQVTGEETYEQRPVARYCLRQEDNNVWEVKKCVMTETINFYKEMTVICECPDLKRVTVFDDYDGYFVEIEKEKVEVLNDGEPQPPLIYMEQRVYKWQEDSIIFVVFIMFTSLVSVIIWSISNDKYDKFLLGVKEQNRLKEQGFTSKEEMDKHYEQEKDTPFQFHEKTIKIDSIVNYGRRHQKNRMQRVPEFEYAESQPLKDIIHERDKVIQEKAKVKVLTPKEGMYMYHKFIGGFIIYDSEIPRVLYFSVYFLEVMNILCWTGGLTVQDYQLHYQLAWGFLIALINAVGGSILRTVIRRPNIIFKFVGAALTWFLILLGVYITFPLIGPPMYKDQSGVWAGAFFMIFILDNIIEFPISLIMFKQLKATYQFGYKKYRTKTQDRIFRIVAHKGILDYWLR